MKPAVGTKVKVELWSILEAMGTAMVILDRVGVVVTANRSALTCLGFDSHDQLVGHRLSEAVPGSETMLEDFSPLSQQQVALVIRGEERTIGFTSSRGMPFGRRALLFKDITRLVALENRRQHAEQLAQVGEIALKLSHEIRNPLANILMGLQTLEKQVFLSSEDNQILHQVLGEVRTLERTISSLLTEARWSDTAPELMRVSTVVRDCADVMSAQARSRNLRVRLEEGPLGAVAVMDDIAMTRILGNLIRNAVDASPEGGTIWVGWRELSTPEIEQRFPGFPSSIVGIFVDDEGDGVPEESRRRIFEPFVTTKENGTGLGLSVVNELVRELGGTVGVTRAPTARGARFEVYLPAGARLRCWEVRERNSNAALPCKRVSDCTEDCPVVKANAGLVCWTIAARAAILETGDWRQECLDCPVFVSANLAVYEAPQS